MQKGNDAALPSGVLADAVKVKPGVFLLVGSRKAIQPVNARTKTPSLFVNCCR